MRKISARLWTTFESSGRPAKARTVFSDIVWCTAKGYSAVFPDGIRRSRVAVLWLPHAARIDHQRPSELRFHRLVRVAQEEEIGVSGPRQFSFPATRRALLSQIVVKRVARRGMAGDTRCARALEPLEGLPAGEKALHLPGEAMAGGGLHGCGHNAGRPARTAGLHPSQTPGRDCLG